LKKIFIAIETARKVSNVPIIFMMYYNTISFYGLDAFAEKCVALGVDGLIVPDLPFEEQGPLQDALSKVEDAPILIQLVAPVSKQRIPMILENARGFVYCVSQMGVTGKGANFHKDIKEYLANVKRIAKVPVMIGFGIKTASDVLPLIDEIDGAIVGSAFIKLLDENDFDVNVAKEYITTFKKEL
jgi:tryptophan synthase alpha chain